MKTVYKIAHCQHGYPDECGADAEFDVPTVSGQWANLCGPHKVLDCLPSADAVGYRLTRVPPPEPDERERRRAIRAAIYSGDFDAAEDLIGDGDPAEWL